ncbi:MAG: lytic transglycosylase domain-containing protein, partial [Nocardioidaceae bacterium]
MGATQTPHAGAGTLTAAAQATGSPLSSDVLPVALKQASVPSGYEQSSQFRASPDLGVPAEAVRAYRFAESVMQRAKPSCGIDWSLLAAIGDVESDHGRYGGADVRPDGTPTPAILGPRLDGSEGTATIADTDDGQLDDDREWDRAVGPMQFIPSTWDLVGSDADGDGIRDPHDIDDAALSAAVYLCAGGSDLSSTQGQRSAVFRYNHSESYVDLVLRLAAAYADGVLSLDLPTPTPESTGTSVDIPSLSQPVNLPAHPARPPVNTEASGTQQSSGGSANDSDRRTQSGGTGDGTSGGTGGTSGGTGDGTNDGTSGTGASGGGGTNHG